MLIVKEGCCDDGRIPNGIYIPLCPRMVLLSLLNRDENPSVPCRDPWRRCSDEVPFIRVDSRPGLVVGRGA